MKQQIKQYGMSVIDWMGSHMLGPPRSGFGHFHNHGPRNHRKVAITFDDGPNTPSSERLLDAMRELDVKGTFFCVGVNAALNPAIVARAFAEGHVIGNHSMGHRRFAAFQLNSGEHIDQAEHEISQIIGCRPLLYRPPWGWLTPWEGQRLTQRGYTIIGWDIYTQDWRLPEPDGEWMAEDACRKAHPGAIILFHDGCPNVKEWKKTETIRAIRHLVPALRAQGYEFVTIPELLNVPAYAPLTLDAVRREKLCSSQ